jgi:ABC-type branched-subunit amino acid transport system substrate-binding protein
MSKLAILRLLDGDLGQGMRLMLTISTATSLSTEVSGTLPPNPNLANTIQQWQANYRSLGATRIRPNKITYDTSIKQKFLECQKLESELRSQLKIWLSSPSFHSIRDKWLEELMKDEVRILVHTSSNSLLRFPWHLWDLVERNPQAEVALSVIDSKPIAKSKELTLRRKVKILAILGDSTGIDIEKDRQLLANLAGAETVFLVEPQRRDINDQLWDQAWDILFFAGHSRTEGEQGRIYINQTDSLTIAELRYALQKAVENGLQLAIFNSCDGMGLALELQQLQLPQVIILRESVLDRVAQEFLKYFLSAFAQGQSLYLSVREARQKLQGLENESPGASWLPVIVQSPASTPPAWTDLGRRPIPFYYQWLSVLLISFSMMGLVTWWFSAQKHNSPLITYGEETFLPGEVTPEKRAGMRSFAEGNYNQAIEHFKSSLKKDSSDPETRIFLQNARIGNQTSHTLAVVLSVTDSSIRQLQGIAGLTEKLRNIKIALAREDDRDVAKKTAEELVKMPEVLGVIGPTYQRAELAASSIYCGKLVNIALISQSSAKQNISCPGFNFHLIPNDRLEAQALSQYILKKMRRQRAVVFFASGNLHSKSLKTEFHNALNQANGKIVHEFDMSSRDFSSSIHEKKALLEQAEVLVLFPSKQLIKDKQKSKLLDVLKLKQNLQNLSLLGGSSAFNYGFLQMVERSKGFGAGMVIAVPCCSTIAKTGDWRNILTKDAIQTFATALKEQPTREGIQKRLSNPDFQAEGESGQIRFGTSGDRNIPMQFVQITHNPNASKSDAQYNFVPVK